VNPPDLNCADICEPPGRCCPGTTGYANVTKAILEACRVVCGCCAADCETHAGRHEHCRLCGEARKRCEATCADLLPLWGEERLMRLPIALAANVGEP
jgi:hypothetical protein